MTERTFEAAPTKEKRIGNLREYAGRKHPEYANQITDDAYDTCITQDSLTGLSMMLYQMAVKGHEEKRLDTHVGTLKEAGTSFGPLFGLAYSPIQASAFGSLALPSLDFGGSEKFTSFM
jgi:hypothetical protein